MVTILQNNNSLKVYIGEADKKELVYKVMVIHVITKTGFFFIAFQKYTYKQIIQKDSS